MTPPTSYQLIRHQDVSQVSGVGHIANVWWWPDDDVAIVEWLGSWPTVTIHWQGIESVQHINGHGGKTEMRMVTMPVPATIRGFRHAADLLIVQGVIGRHLTSHHETRKRVPRQGAIGDGT